MSKPYVMHGWHLSYFAGKTRAYLRYKGIDFIDHPVDAYNLLWRIPRKTGATVMPVVVTPQGEWLQDTKHIVDVLETRYPQRPVLPSTPRQRIAALLIEAWADEYWMPTAMHYRWSFPENFALFQKDAGSALLPGFPRFLQLRIVDYVAKTLRGYLPSVGVVPAQFETLERWTTNMLDVLDRHFAVHPYLLGGKPSVADFALLGPMYGHLGRDPYPRRVLVEPRPHLKSWVERMNAPPAQLQGEWLADDALAPTLAPVIDSVLREFYPMIAAVRDELLKLLPAWPAERTRLPRGLGSIEIPMAGKPFRRMALPYMLWMQQRVLDSYRALNAADRASVDAWMKDCGAPAAMQFDNRPRLRQTGLHVSLDR